ncbi:putative pentatricopeptide repeat-containing protein At5g06400, mitochondrial isoform X1 [Dendrobium catenatum]|uniref:Pentatricopeptide repeat-containing protein n=2 Tax=Dendrobium catenatum TaxID=906689 RepID=A0A2I0WD12_9ASPA|nr:putative pentatricopeptide repeat-containing protein At5g06400, mitochondrial isoform X1 [Dendrobium catenatum]PKU73548.1 Putative pentatricopeptide repeat-containing protein [Dendrobium catenatum]
MRTASKLTSPHSLSRPSPASLLFSRCKSSLRRPASASPPSLYQMITEIVPINVRDTEQQATTSTQGVRQNVRQSNSTSQIIAGKALLKATDLEEISAAVHKVTEIIRSDNIQIPMEQRLKVLGIAFTPETVEMVLKRCFKVGSLAFRFFNWMKLQPGFRHTTETYNTMSYIAGEAGEFDLVEKLMEDMDADLCSKNIKTWTILISQYANVKKIGKALWTFEEMRKSGCKLDSGVYEAILRGLCSARKAELAFEFYKEMVLKKMKVDIKIYTMLMDCLSIAGDIVNASLVGEDMMKIAELPETEVLTIMLRSFCISGKVDEAWKLFEEMRVRNLSVDSNVYEALVKGFCRVGRIDEAMGIVDDMKHSLNAGNRIYGCLIDGFLRKGKAWKALELLHSMRELGCLPMVSSYTQVIQHLFRSDQYGKACEIYEEMLENGIEADIVATTAVVAGHVQHNNISEAWRVFNDMKRKGLVPTWKAYSVFIKELCKASNPNEAFKLLSEMSACKINPTDHIFRLVISSLKRNGQLEKAGMAEQQHRSFRFSHRESEQFYDLTEHQEVSVCSSDHNLVCREPPNVLDENDVEELCRILSSSANSDLLLQTLDRSTITFTPELVEAVLRRSQRHGSSALQFFSWVGKQPNYTHNTETYNMAIKIAGSGKDFKHMRTLYHEMRRRCCSIEPNTWTIMISQYGQAGLTEIALKTFKEMKSEGYQPNGDTFKYLIVYLCGKKGRKIEEAIKVFQEMLPSGYMPDKEMVDIFLSSLCESRKFSEARRAVNSLCKRGFQNQIAYSLLIKSLCRAGQVDEAIVLTDEFENLGCKVDQYIYASIVHALLRKGRLEAALEKLEDMKRAGISQSVHIKTSLIVHFFRKKHIEKALEIYKKMREEGCEPTVITYSALIRGFMNMGMFSDALNIFHRMKIKGPFPDFQTYSMFMTCLCKQGRSADAFKLIHDMLESQIIPSAVNFRTVYYGLNREGKQDLAHLVLKMKWSLKKQRMHSI